MPIAGNGSERAGRSQCIQIVAIQIGAGGKIFNRGKGLVLTDRIHGRMR